MWSENMAKVSNFRELIVWQKTMDLAELIYQSTRAFPKDELYGMVSQMRRAAVSIPSNIAEGQARNTTGEFIQFLGYAHGSLAELETQTELAGRFNWLNVDERQRLILD